MTRLNIAQLEAERSKNGPGPFEVEMPDGVVFTFKDIRSLNWKLIVGFDPKQPTIKQLSAIMDKKEFEAFEKRDDITAYVLEDIMSGYLAHFGLPRPGEASGSRE